jgi:hypothetical protein
VRVRACVNMHAINFFMKMNCCLFSAEGTIIFIRCAWKSCCDVYESTNADNFSRYYKNRGRPLNYSLPFVSFMFYKLLQLSVIND